MKPIITLRKISDLEGYFDGYSQPSVIAEFSVKAINNQQILDNVKNVKPNLFPGLKLEEVAIPQAGIQLSALLEMYLLILTKANAPYFSLPKVLNSKKSSQSGIIYTVVIPTVAQPVGFTKEILLWAARFVNDCQQPIQDISQHRKTATKLSELLEHIGLALYNAYNFARAAQEMDAPWLKLNQTMMQIGWGVNSHWFSSSIGPKTASVAVAMTSNKQFTTELLRNAGFPIVPSQQVTSLEQVNAFIKKVGYPVVLKPLSLSGGKGVYCNLHTEEAVIAAFTEIKTLVPSMLVEQHFAGRDYRVQVYNGQAYWVVHRIPAFLTGDGKSTISELITAKNKFRSDFYNGIGLLSLNPETTKVLLTQGYTSDSIPKNDVHVILSEVANVSKGGEIKPVLDIAHPDNLQLAEQAAQYCRIDIAGVDILLPDITVSWRETGAHICEVNAQPHMSQHLPKHVLADILKGGSRIPVNVIVAKDTESFKILINKLAPLNQSNSALVYSQDTADALNTQSITKQFNAAVTNRAIEKITLIYVFNEVNNRISFPFDKADDVFIEQGVDIKYLNKSLISRCKHQQTFDATNNKSDALQQMISAIQ